MKEPIFVLICLVGLVAGSVRGQWVRREIPLNPGWNAICLNVEPYPAECDELFASYPAIESVWRWNANFSSVDFSEDPLVLLPSDDTWLRWYPSNHTYRIVRNLYTFQGNVPHLIQVATNAASFTMSVTGTPLLPEIDWLEYQLNLVGLPIAPDNPPDFNTFFSDTPDIGALPDVDNGAIYRINAAADGVQILQPARTKIQQGEAYWVLCQDKTDYAGPLRIATGSGGGVIDFGSSGVESTLQVANVLTSRVVTVTVSLESSAAPPAGQPPNAGELPIGYLATTGTNVPTWRLLESSLTQTIEPSTTWTLNLCVWRGDIMTNAPGVYQGLFKVTEANGLSHSFVPIKATVEGY